MLIKVQSIASSTTSISNSILEGRLENGRTYHKYKEGSKRHVAAIIDYDRFLTIVEYSYPNDERESDRLGRSRTPDMQHTLFLLTTDDRLGLAPPNSKGSSVKRAIDIGTGTGIWTTDFGDEHPEADVLGVDLSPVPTAFVPPNVRFEVDDVEEPWTYSQPFDYIHVRGMTSSITDWKRFFIQCYGNLEPGGWLEVQEGHMRAHSDDGTLKPDSSIVKWVDLLEEAAEKFGRPFADCPSLAKLMEEVGFVDVSLKMYKWPLNPWPKDPHYRELGAWNFSNFIKGIEAITMAPFTRGHGWTKEEVQIFLIGLRKELSDMKIHAWIPMYMMYGRKPTEVSQ
ncbi:methyltransferase domain-containing protein [Colletotrichum sojae]|uniref:Methyltransferase domain-containing protein n=1 Tax=Colletotrichum sojae TaxID=2175907 RepID=A0A8H6N0M5_9PEZI|nr:methyltransferase domain-containing protein [Colletotrichum sojae]